MRGDSFGPRNLTLSTILFDVLVRLLPRHRRRRYGEEMRAVHHALAEDARRAGRSATAVLLMKEVGGLLRFALRERLTRLGDWRPMGGGWHPLRELHWACRGVRARGARAGLIVLLVGLALAGNVLIFAVADSLVFNRVPYSDADAIVEIQSVRTPGQPGDRFLSPALLDEWRKQTDLFSSVQAYLTKNVFVISEGRSEIVSTADVTPGLIELLGALPQFGRSLTGADALETAVIPSLISARLASQLFGRPAAAVGKRIETTAHPLLVAGVMADDFMFPDGRTRLWRAMDPRGPLTRNFVGVQSIARMAPDLSMAHLAAQMEQRSAGIGRASGAHAGYEAMPGPFYMSSIGGADRARTLFLVLLGGAVCLLLTACANVASLELAGVLRRARTSAIQMALGASRATLARVALSEGAVLLGAAVALGGALAWVGIGAIETLLPARMTWLTANAIDIDQRTLFFMAVIAAAAWLLTSLPAVLFASQTTLLQLIRTEDRSASASRAGVLARRALTMFEVAVAVMLVAGASMYTRSYVALLGVDKGFDASNLIQLSFTIPSEYYDRPGEHRAFADEVLARVKTMPGVIAAMAAGAPPSIGNSPTGGLRLALDGRLPGDETFRIGESNVPVEYRQVVGLPLRSGRWFEPNDPPTHVVIPEGFARRLWPDGQAIGRTFRRVSAGREQPTLQVIGVVGDFRTERPDATNAREPAYHYFTVWQPPSPQPPVTAPTKPRPPSTGGSWRFLEVAARLDSPDRAAAVLEAARTVDPRLRVTLESVDDKYAAMFSDVLLATRVTNAFGALALLVAVVGVYGVMSYLVTGRRREIGIRMALGADRRDVGRLVMTSAVRLAAIGAAAGVAGALAVARWTSSQFYGVSPMDPITYLAVAAVILATAILATWQPARHAARIDPAVTLRAE